MKITRTSNRRAVADARRSFSSELKAANKAPAGKLSEDEESKLYDLIDNAHSSNRRLVEGSRELDEARNAYKVACIDLKIAEESLAQERAANQRIHAEMASLFHRLTA